MRNRFMHTRLFRVFSRVALSFLSLGFLWLTPSVFADADLVVTQT